MARVGTPTIRLNHEHRCEHIKTFQIPLYAVCVTILQKVSDEELLDDSVCGMKDCQSCQSRDSHMLGRTLKNAVRDFFSTAVSPTKKWTRRLKMGLKYHISSYSTHFVGPTGCHDYLPSSFLCLSFEQCSLFIILAQLRVFCCTTLLLLSVLSSCRHSTLLSCTLDYSKRVQF